MSSLQLPAMGGRRRHRRKSWTYGDGPIHIRVGSRRSSRRYHEVEISDPGDVGRFVRIIDEQVRAHPLDPLIISVNGYQSWFEEVLSSCIQDDLEDLNLLARELQFSSTMQFPEKASRRAQYVPWTFILDQMNVPQVYYWSIGIQPPANEKDGLPAIENFRFRIGVWQMGRGACRFDRNVSVTIIFTRQTEVSELVVTELLFGYLYKDDDFYQPREDEEGICWIFSRLYWLLTDWQNIISELVLRLDEAEDNSHGRHLPVKMRARMMHHEIDRIYELKQYLNFHTRAFQKLAKLKDLVPQNEQRDPLWDDMNDALEDLKQYDQTIDGLKERFNNLLDLEFNIQNAVQSDNAQFLSVVATLFLPVSFLASLFGMTTISWPAIWYLYIAIPVLVVSACFTAIFPWSVQRVQRLLYPVESLRMPLQPRSFTLLGDELPDSANAPGGVKGGGGRVKRKGTRPAGMDDEERVRARSMARRQSEKDDL